MHPPRTSHNVLFLLGYEDSDDILLADLGKKMNDASKRSQTSDNPPQKSKKSV